MNNELIVLTGPESSGKTTLAIELSNYWQAPLVPEVSRDYLKQKTSYQQHDLLEIAKQQYKEELSAISSCSGKVVCDTDLLVIMIWSEVKYGHCDSWIYKTFEKSIKQKSLSRFYYLCDYNIPWQDDPLRENPNNRDELFDLYLEKIRGYGLSHSIVKGSPQERLQQVLNICEA
jgi:nicotinamide riboside kinase